MGLSKKIPTDREVLKKIYNEYYDTYENFSKDDDHQNRNSKIYVPIEIEKIAKKLNAENDIVFGRLYYYLKKKYSYENSDKSKVELFSLGVGGDRHVVHFPLLASILADFQEKRKKDIITIILSIISFAISVVALMVSIF